MVVLCCPTLTIRRSAQASFFFFSSRRRHTRCREVSWARRCVQETGLEQLKAHEWETFCKLDENSSSWGTDLMENVRADIQKYLASLEKNQKYALQSFHGIIAKKEIEYKVNSDPYLIGQVNNFMYPQINYYLAPIFLEDKPLSNKLIMRPKEYLPPDICDDQRTMRRRATEMMQKGISEAEDFKATFALPQFISNNQTQFKLNLIQSHNCTFSNKLYLQLQQIQLDIICYTYSRYK
eukprot:TRINITY_DN29872_c0_g4_i1.p1 TRINITY_DN29872_c0_g4~~TRINITY_DN29872_c0_g4_i1.p1  ORF type:complete len:237 (+),score=19.59 TRINITY_DN29872_c0_g4_i1:83-793(+)